MAKKSQSAEESNTRKQETATTNELLAAAAMAEGEIRRYEKEFPSSANYGDLLKNFLSDIKTIRDALEKDDPKKVRTLWPDLDGPSAKVSGETAAAEDFQNFYNFIDILKAWLDERPGGSSLASSSDRRYSDEKFAEIISEIKHLDEKIDDLDERIDNLDGRIDNLDKKVDYHVDRLSVEAFRGDKVLHKIPLVQQAGPRYQGAGFQAYDESRSRRGIRSKFRYDS